jgi:prepilin-type N-terminal cleavage/methylation domain-containing protein
MTKHTHMQPVSAPRGHKFLTCVSRSPARIRPAFTLVELLVVIGIIAVLAGLVTPAVMRAQATARNAAIKAEIDMLHMAIMNYKNQYSSFPPCTTGTFGITNTGANPASRHLARLFPRISTSGIQARCLPYLNNPSQPIAAATAITPDTSIVCWLYGYSDDPTMPVLGPNSTFAVSGTSSGTITFSPTPTQRQKLYDFDSSRISSYRYFPSNRPGAPYLYINCSQTALEVDETVRFSRNLLYSGTTATQLASPGAQYMPATPLPAKPDANYPDAWWFTNTSGSQQLFNGDTFQILCAGRDEQFGNGDDLSNFWPGTRQDYLDSIRQ